MAKPREAAPEFPSPFEDDSPEAQGAEAEVEEREEAAAEEWEPPSRESWEAAQRDLQSAQERERRAAESAEQTQRMLAQMLGSQQPPPPRQAETETPAIDLSAMPDPVSDREGYGRWLGEQLTRAEKRALARVSEVQQRVEGSSRADRLYNGFCEQYPTLRDKRPLVESAAIAAGLTGNEPESVIFQRTAETLKGWGISVEGGSKPDPSRSTAVGGPSSGAPRKRRSAEPEPKDLVDELAEQQVKLGIM